MLDGPLLSKLILAIRACGVNFNVYESKEKEGVEWPSLLGPDKVKLLKLLPDKMPGCQPPEMVELTQKLWKVSCLICTCAKSLFITIQEFLLNIQHCYRKIINFTTQFKGVGK